MKGKTLFKRIVLILIIPHIIITISAYLVYALIYHQNLNVPVLSLPLIWILLFILSVIIHELGHFFTFMYYRYSVKAFMVLGMVLKSTKPYLTWDVWGLKMAGGLVIPKLKEIQDEHEFVIIKKQIRMSLLMGPIFTYLFLLMIITSFWIHPHPMIFISSFLLLPITYMFHKSFFIELNSLYGDYKAYKKLKHDDDDILLLLYHQHSMLYKFEPQTLTFIYQKVANRLSQKHTFHMKNDMPLIMILLDGIRLGYITDYDDLIDLIPKNHPYFKKEAYAIVLSTYIWILMYVNDYDKASEYYLYMLKHRGKYQHALVLFHHFLYHDTIDNITFNEIKSHVFIYRHIAEEKSVLKHFDTAHKLTLECII
jgi:hypothetical protein